MADIVSKERRREIMSSVKGINTKPELTVRKFLFQHGFRYRLNDKSLPGRPDIKLTKYKTIVFINGCFWHGHENCKTYVMPKTNTIFWQEKIKTNVARDIRNESTLKLMGWKVITVWSCELTKNRRLQTLESLIGKILA